MARSTTHYADSETNNILKRLHNKLRPAGTPVMRVEYIIELLLLRIFEAKLKQDEAFAPLRKLFAGENYRLLFSHLLSLNGEQILSELNKNIFPFYSTILSKTRTITTGNLPQKMQDQLVLMEEVFANSNFTNNVKGGVIAEVIGMVNEIDEKYILKTDLLGDAIESALSETGGTKDLGLYRTPDHIRKMMVEMVDPDFTDTIYDPACGTAGFLFDAYDYVIEKAQKTRQMPSENVANMFYRNGIGGVEYAGMIRKMAAINLYIRGLNPHNIQQGDSLALYDPSKDAGSKSIIIANPPFGAEKDQPAYPNVWEDYPKGDTTTLFVKLMFDLLNTQGRCAVIISEGLLTWNSGDAVSLRKLLLNEANLRAIISLPQGVFVSKSGQGAKTSILYFEKGQPTDSVWYYKIENDGFSMGTNRKEIAGSQIPEILEIFKEVKQGKKPQNTKHSFCISKEQIETLDPRIAERITNEVSEKTKEKNIKKREKLVEELDKKLKNKKISKELYDEKLWQFDNIIEGQIDNEVAKAIEKAHSYNFNLQNYCSSLSDEQIKDWQQTLEDVEINNGSKIGKRYQELQKIEPKTALQILASFDSKNALQMDIAREYLSKLDKKVLGQNGKLLKLEEILRKGFQYPMIKLGKVLVEKDNNLIKIEDDKNYREITLKLYGQGMTERRIARGDEITFDLCQLLEENDIITSIHQFRNGCFVAVPKEFAESIASKNFLVYSVDPTILNPLFLQYIVTSKKQIKEYQGKSQGGATPIYPREDILEVQVPLPPLEAQNEIVEKIEKQKQIIDGAEKIDIGFSVDQFIDTNYDEEFIEKLAQVEGSPVKDLSKLMSETYVGGENIESGSGRLLNLQTVQEAGIIGPSYEFRKGHVVYSKVRPNLQKCFFAAFNGICSSDIYPLKINEKLVLPRYFALILQSKFFAKKTESFQDGRSGMPKINQDQLSQIKIPLPPLETQRQIVEKLDLQMQALEGVRLLKSEAEKRIEEILAEVWGE